MEVRLVLSCKEVRLFCSEGLKRCFVGFVSSRNSLLIIIFPAIRLGAVLRQFARKTVDSLVESSEYDLRSLDFLQTVLQYFL